jgi:hypothetical protein
MQSKNRTALVTGEYRRIKDLLRVTTRAQARPTLLQPELHISHVLVSNVVEVEDESWKLYLSRLVGT